MRNIPQPKFIIFYPWIEIDCDWIPEEIPAPFRCRQAGKALRAAAEPLARGPAQYTEAERLLATQLVKCKEKLRGFRWDMTYQTYQLGFSSMGSKTDWHHLKSSISHSYLVRISIHLPVKQLLIHGTKPRICWEHLPGSSWADNWPGGFGQNSCWSFFCHGTWLNFDLCGWQWMMIIRIQHRKDNDHHDLSAE